MLARDQLIAAIFPVKTCGSAAPSEELFATEESIAAALKKAAPNPAASARIRVSIKNTLLHSFLMFSLYRFSSCGTDGAVFGSF